MLRAPISLAGSTRRGMVTAQVALSLSALMAMLAVVTDGGLLLVERRHAQATADAAALAAASDLYAKWNTNKGLDSGNSAYNSAIGVASANGYTNDGTTSTVIVNVPPGKYSGGPNAGKALPAGYAEATVTWYQPRGFSGVFGSGAIPVSARAVARGAMNSSTPSILLLSTTADPALQITGNAISPGIKVNGAIDVNSTASNSMAITGNITLAAAGYNLAAGSPGYSKAGNITMTGTVLNGQSPASNPLSYLPTPNTSGLTTQSASQLQLVGNGTATLQPGVYIGGISITGNYNTVTLNPGIYYLEGGGLSVTGNITMMKGSGVMIYNAPNTSSDTINLTGNIGLNLSPMTSGLYAGLTIFQNPTSTAALSIVGNAGSSITGTIYAAGAQVSITGNTTTQIGSQFIASTLNIMGNTSFSVGGSGAPVAQARDVGLVE
jgi:Putative Flp pilus-assembly TadE/G-like